MKKSFTIKAQGNITDLLQSLPVVGANQTNPSVKLMAKGDPFASCVGMVAKGDPFASCVGMVAKGDPFASCVGMASGSSQDVSLA